MHVLQTAKQLFILTEISKESWDSANPVYMCLADLEMAAFPV